MMFGLGTLINTAAIVAGGLLGLVFGRFIKDRHQETLVKACGVSVLFIGIAGALCGMLSVIESGLVTANVLLVVVSIALGALIGEILNIEGWFERFGAWLMVKTGSSKDRHFIEGFVCASLTVCIGAMAIIGSIEDGISGDISILAAKAVLDFVIVMVMAGALGRGCVFSAIPVFVFQGAVTVLAFLVSPLINDLAIANLSMVGSILIFCVGINLVWGKQIRAANLLPAVVIAAAAAYVPVLF
jgi:Uncharacterized membrane protein, possible Na+ channel or pump